MNIDLLDRDDSKTGPPCKGLLFRCREETYTQSNGAVVFRQVFTPLKRMSCPGCQDCGWLLDELQEAISDKYMHGPVVEDAIVTGGLYRLDTINQSRDWETGVIDAWDLAFVLVKE